VPRERWWTWTTRSVSQAWRIARCDGGRDLKASSPEVDTSKTRQATSTGMGSAAMTAAAWNRLLGHHLSDQLHRPAHRVPLSLQLSDPAFGRGQLALLATGQPRFQAAVDAVLAAPGGDRLVGDPKRLGDLGDRAAGLDQIQDLAAELRLSVITKLAES
jgi:hypothetical protein